MNTSFKDMDDQEVYEKYSYLISSKKYNQNNNKLSTHTQEK